MSDPKTIDLLFKLIEELSEDEKRILVRFIRTRKDRSKAADRRRYPRKPYLLDVNFRVFDRHYHALSKDISEGGILIESDEPLRYVAIGQHIDFDIRNPKLNHNLNLKGRIVRLSRKEIAARFSRRTFA